MLRPLLSEADGPLAPVRGQGGHEVDLKRLNADDATLNASSPDRPSVVALDDILAWDCDPNARPLYALLGEYGMGKTTTCQRVVQQLRQRHEAGGNVPVPLYFDLRKVERLVATSATTPGLVPALREAVEDCLRHGYLHEGGEVPRFEDVLTATAQGAVIFFDGLDEVLSRIGEKQCLTSTATA